MTALASGFAQQVQDAWTERGGGLWLIQGWVILADVVGMGMVEAVRAGVRDRRLAGLGRAGVWTKQRVRRDQLAFARRHWLRLTLALLVAAAVIAAVAWGVPTGFWRGFVVGVLGTTVVAALFVVVMQATGSAPRSMGASAEEWTAGELRPLRRHGWTLVNHFGLGRGDIDHVLVGRAAIVVAETKWSADGWAVSMSDARLRTAISQVKESTRSVRLWTGADHVGLPVQPVLVLWGGSAARSKDVTDPVVLDGVTVLQGLAAVRAWRHQLHNTAPIAPIHVIDMIIGKIRDQLHRRDAYEAAANPAPPSFDRVYWTLGGCASAAIAGSLTLLEPLTWGWRWPVLGIVGISLAGGLLARRYRPARYFADAWLAGVAGIGLVAVLVLALA